MKRNIILLISLFFTITLFSQEICDNGIDDDGDGLIDLNDNDCACSATGSVTVPSLIPNPSFEDYSCCPSTYSQLSCADTWIQATDATSDYMNTCDFVMNAGIDAGLIPCPDGDGMVGAIYAETWQEYVGACLSSPLLSGTQYDLVMNIASTPINAYGDVCNSGNIYYGDIDITIFGSTSCANLPASGNGCPGSPWQVIGTQTYTPVNSWGTIDITFTPSQNINAVIIGSPCNLPATGYEYGATSESCYPYFYFDNLILNTSTAFNPVSVSQTGNLCSNDLLLTATASGSGTYQWYYEGVAIVGQTGISLNASTAGFGAGTYQVMYTDAGGCSVAEITVVQDVVNITIDNTQNISCNAGANGSISITASGGTTAYNYDWTGPGGFNSSNEDISGLAAGTYNLTVNDANSCNETITVTLTEPPPLLLSTTSINESCQGLSDGSIDLTISGGTPNYLISWDNGASTEDISGLVAGTFNVTVTDANNCQETTQVTITNSSNPVPTITGNDFCQGLNSTLDAGAGYVSYSWDVGGFTTQTINVLNGGTYNVTVTDANGCQGTDNITITQNPNPTPTITGNNFCTGTHAALDAGAGYSTYLWTTTEQTQSITISTGGTYTVTVTDANGCQGTDDITITEYPLPTPTITGNDFCSGTNSSLDAGVGYNSYLWNTTEQTQNITITTGGTYNVSVTDANGCQGVDDITISEYPLPTPTITGSDFCQGSSSIIDAGGGYNSYSWDIGGNTQTLTITAGGTFTVSVTDANGCEGSDNITIAEIPNPTPTITGNDFCSGSTSSLDAGAGYSSYLWNTTEQTQNITISTGGTYDVVVTDANGCQGTDNITITEYPLPTPTITGSLTFCSGYSTILDAGSGTGYTYLWNTTESTQQITVSTGGTYSVVITDANSCQGTDQVTVTEATNLSPIITGVPSICAGNSTILDAGAGYATYDWSTTDNTQTITVGTTGTYSVTVSDASGCTGNTSIDIVENPLPTPTISGNDFCAGTNTTLSVTNTYNNYIWSTSDVTPTTNITSAGTYSVTVTDANGCEGSDNITINTLALPTPVIVGNDFCDGTIESLYTTNTYSVYQWNTAQSTAMISVNTGGTYIVTVTDANGCEGSGSISLNTLSLPTPTITGNDFCAGTNSILDGGNYSSWDWNTSETTQQITITSGGTYTITVTDANGCEGSDDITIVEIPNPTPAIYGDLEICEGENTILNVGGTYSSYLWSSSQSSQSITVTITGTYSVTVDDANGCEGTTSVDVVVHPNPTPEITGVLAICKGSSATLDAGAGYSIYQWSTSENNQSISTGIAGQYAVTVTDANGCSGIDYTSLNVDNLVISVNPQYATICSGTDINISATVITGIPSYTYTWSNGFTGGSTQTVNPTNNSTYTVFVTDGMGCISNTETINIDIIPGVQLDIFTNKDTICPGDPLLITQLTQYGIPPYTIYDQYNNIVSLNYVAYPEQSGDFIYTVVDACNSTDADTITINFYPIPNLLLQANITQGCEPLEVYLLEGNIQNNSGYSYVWDFDDNNDNNLSLTPSPIHIFETSGSYDISLHVTTPNGCEVSTTVYNMINVFPNPDAKFDVLPDIKTIIEPTFDFDNYSEDALSYIWNFDDGDSSNIFEPSHTYQNIGEYLVELIAISNYGCKDTAEHLIRVKDVFTLYVPTAFSPDNDGINDFFFTKGTGIDTDNFNLIIYDRWGEIIWQTDDYFAKWDGRAKGGDKFVEVGTYTWLVNCKDFEENEHQKSGTVTVIR